MNGPEHYAEAERLLAQVADVVSLNYSAQTGEEKADVLAAAQVHATLALVAATANADPGEGGYQLADAPTPWDGNRNGDGLTWQSVTA
jgi:hypothetical protein